MKEQFLNMYGILMLCHSWIGGWGVGGGGISPHILMSMSSQLDWGGGTAPPTSLIGGVGGGQYFLLPPLWS